LQSLLADREMLLRATQDPSSFIVAPGAVLSSQPGLKRLREGLVDAQLAGSQLTGKFTESHPSVIASQSSQSSIIKRFLQELKASIAGVESDVALVNGRIERLERQKNALQNRLATLADNRAPYANLLSEVKSKVSILESAERELAEVQAARDSSITTSLLTRLDAPSVSDRPIGPGRTTICGLCTIAGLVFGLGIVFVVTPIDAGPTFGRRSHDRQRGRRDADLIEEKAAGSPLQTDSSIVSKPATNNVVESIATPSASPAELQLPSGSQLRPFHPKEQKPPISPNATHVPTLNESDSNVSILDKTFEELSKLQSQTPISRSEELSLEMKIQELKHFLSRDGVPAGPEKNMQHDTMRTKPRQTKPTQIDG